MNNSDISESIRVFLAAPIPVDDSRRLNDAISVLSAEEVERADRFRFDGDRSRFITGRALVRYALSRFANVEPADWRFGTNDLGRPLITGPAEIQRLRFSASRTDRLVMCGVTRGRQIGVDLECLRDHPANVVEHYFSRNEARTIRQSAPAERSRLFFANWTLKEAYCKAKGMGLSIPLQKISFAFENQEPELTIVVCAP